MDYEIIAEGVVAFRATSEEVLTLRHCIIEALEALGDNEFNIRTGGPKADAEGLLATLKRVSVELAQRDESCGFSHG